MIPGERVDPGKGKSIVLAVLMHVLLVAVLFLGVHWQNRPPEPVAVEVWRSIPQPSREPEPEPEPRPEPKPEPKAEPTKTPDIAVKTEPPKKKEPPKPEPVKKPETTKKTEPPQPEPPRYDPREDAARELRQIQESNAKAERELREAQQAKQAQLALARAKYIDKISAKVKGNLINPPDLKGNPVALFAVTQLPSGEVMDVQLKRSSGHRAYDEAIERAIRKSSPLPKPDDPSQFVRELNMKFCPDDRSGSCP